MVPNKKKKRNKKQPHAQKQKMFWHSRNFRIDLITKRWQLLKEAIVIPRTMANHATITQIFRKAHSAYVAYGWSSEDEENEDLLHFVFTARNNRFLELDPQLTLWDSTSRIPPSFFPTMFALMHSKNTQITFDHVRFSGKFIQKVYTDQLIPLLAASPCHYIVVDSNLTYDAHTSVFDITCK